jgi:hypothetical protein
MTERSIIFLPELLVLPERADFVPEQWGHFAL